MKTAYRSLAGAAALFVLSGTAAAQAGGPELFRGAGLRPFEVSRYELELVAYQDGSRFGRHIDTMRAGDADESDRLLTGVYYFHAEPKAFTGGALRLYRFGHSGDAAGDYVDIEPEQNMLLVFPSWASHEVRLVNWNTRAGSKSLMKG